SIADQPNRLGSKLRRVHGGELPGHGGPPLWDLWSQVSGCPPNRVNSIQLLTHRYLKTWLVGLVDDHSRYVLGLRIQSSAQLAPILTWLRDCIELCGQPLAVMSDNGSPFVVWMPGVLTAFGKTLQEMAIRHIRTQINSPWTNGKIERFWKLLQAEVLDREVFRSLEQAEVALNRFAAYYNYHRLSGAIGWLTPAERFDGTPFTDRGFENIPALEHLQDWLAELMRAA
ncbi:MAG TPA: integrase core domain-containing protein, partial [Candidatus Acidoferrum sp.]|nr:integrase core domain-containing protein [Candidatus Acidoferrum sp.]